MKHTNESVLDFLMREFAEFFVDSASTKEQIEEKEMGEKESVLEFLMKLAA